MKELFCSYEQSLALKELGFNEPCLSYFDITGEQQIGTFDFTTIKGYKEYNAALAPLKSQVFKWFREKHGLLGSLNVIDNCATFYYEYEIVNHKDIEYHHDGHQARRLWNTLKFDTYEEAEDACIDKLIKLIKTNKQ